MRHVLSFFLMMGLAAAQQTCPVTVEYVNPWPIQHPKGSISIKYKNTGDKEIQAAEFRVLAFDAMNESHSLLERYVSDNHVKPGKTTTHFWQPSLLSYEWKDATKNGVEAHLYKVLYTDGTKWEDDGSSSCMGGDNYRKKATKK